MEYRQCNQAANTNISRVYGLFNDILLDSRYVLSAPCAKVCKIPEMLDANFWIFSSSVFTYSSPYTIERVQLQSLEQLSHFILQCNLY